MTSEQWQAIKSLTQAALERSTAERKLFLDDSCAGDLTLRQGIEALVTWHEQLTTAEQQTRGFTTNLLAREVLTPERWQRLKQIYQAATELASDKRAVYLAQACAGDDALLREAQSLLAYQTAIGGLAQVPTDDLLPTPVLQAAAAMGAPAKAQAQQVGYVPGAILAGRYRIVGPLGRGGMGQVNRADDLKLGQPVALKFLSERFARDAVMLAQFHNEVRTARQVSHPNVCRVHDIGEIDGQHFISMEYVDGEDLASLLRRIGRLPADKAVEIAQQICAGLAAAHENGVLHRDLKPANVMIDGRGKARLTDFGIAAVAEELHGEEALAGTPAYMAPEQFANRVATVKSDLYALGLVLYELFTGKRAFEATSLTQYISLHRQHTPTNPSSWIKDIDPLVERVIMRCLEKDPNKRPASAAQVAAALPGGDPLAAAIAAGETPSPEMVAAAPKAGALRPPVALACLAGFLLLLALLVLATGKVQFHRWAPLEKPPEVLAERAGNFLQKLGYANAPAARAYGFNFDDSYLEYVRYVRKDTSPQRMERIRAGQPLTFYFWYRQSPRWLEPLNATQVTQSNPPLLVSGMTRVIHDPRGRLVEFIGVPPRLETGRQREGETAKIEPVVDWAALFNEAGLDPAKFKQAEPRWSPPTFAYTRAAWEGQSPDHADIALRIEAAAYQGQPVYFRVVAPWDKPARQVETQMSARDRVGIFIFTTTLLTVLAGAALLARRNLRLGRGDRQGAFKLALFVFAVTLLGLLIGADHVPALGGESDILYQIISSALFSALVLWLIYIALEPYVRRHWPQLLISWSRLLAGDFHDPMVGRDLLIGGLFGLGHAAAVYAAVLGSQRLNPFYGPGVPVSPATLSGFRELLQFCLTENLRTSIFAGLATMFFLFLLYLLLRKQWVAGVVMWVLMATIQVLFFGHSWPLLLGNLVIAMLTVIVTARFGLLSGTLYQFCFQLTMFYPLTTDLTTWYADRACLALAVLVVLAGYGFYTSLGDQKLIPGKLLDD
jgi:hypothetical protein